MTTASLGAIPAPRGRGRPKGSLNKKTLARLALQLPLPIISEPKPLREDNLRLSDSLRKNNTPESRAARTFSKIGHRYLNEAMQVLREHPHMNPAWKRNIAVFLQRCVNEVPYIANWHWAIHALKTFKKVYAPFRYFKMCLVHPQKFKITMGDPATREKATFQRLKKTKGIVAARSWAAKHAGAWYNTKALLMRRERRRLGYIEVEDAKLCIEGAAVAALSPLEVFERERDRLKALEYERGWRDDA